MLTDAQRESGRRVALQVGNTPFREVLAELLRQWSFEVVPAPAPLLLRESDPLAAGWWLQLEGGGSAELIPLPLDLGDLYTALERRFHDPPRAHMRLPLQLTVTVQARSFVDKTELINLSDMGGRFRYPRELAPGEEVVICITSGDEKLLLESRVIYCIDCRELRGGDFQCGVLFDRQSAEWRHRLRGRLSVCWLQRVGARLENSVLSEAADCLKLPPGYIPGTDDPFLGGAPAIS